ncbi:hypothetical protein B0O99DRAFT_633246 [Bisporella sp. PMI_857]|nr:hypothetical protein B0O99DRAFT_633246 [Bisporella sp. PMI_857]
MQSPLFVRTDSELSSDTLSCDGFSDTSYDDDNASLESEDLSPVSIDSTLVNSRRNTRVHFSPQHATKDDDGEEEPCSTNPFAKNYRKKADWDDETRKRMEREWFFVEDFIEKYESSEHAEYTRPFDQFRVLISVRPVLPPLLFPVTWSG